MKTIYTVEMYGGEYEDRFNFILATFDDLCKASQLVERLEKLQEETVKLSNREVEPVAFGVSTIKYAEQDDDLNEIEDKIARAYKLGKYYEGIE